MHALYAKKIGGQQWDAQPVEGLWSESGAPENQQDQRLSLGPSTLSESMVELGNDEIKSYARGTVLKLCHGGWGIGRD